MLRERGTSFYWKNRKLTHFTNFITSVGHESGLCTYIYRQVEERTEVRTLRFQITFAFHYKHVNISSWENDRYENFVLFIAHEEYMFAPFIAHTCSSELKPNRENYYGSYSVNLLKKLSQLLRCFHSWIRMRITLFLNLACQKQGQVYLENWVLWLQQKIAWGPFSTAQTSSEEA